MKHIKQWLGIIMTAVLIVGSLEAQVYAGETGATATEAVESDSIESAEIAEDEEPEIDSIDEESTEEDSAGESTQEESVPENVDTVEDIQDISSDSEPEKSVEEPEALTEDETTDQDASYIDAIEPQEPDTELAPEDELTQEQVQAFQDKVKIWKYDNEITIVYDSTEEISLSYSLYSGKEDELLYEGNLNWNEKNGFYYEAVDFDAINKANEEDDFEEINIKDTPVKVVLDDGNNQFVEIVSQGVDALVIEAETKDEDTSLEWSTNEEYDGYSVYVSDANDDSTISVYDVIESEIDLDISEEIALDISVAPYKYNEDIGVKYYGEAGTYGITGLGEEEEDQDNRESEIVEAAEESMISEAANGVIADGTCGNNLTWTLDEEGTLTISGTGEMRGYSNKDSYKEYTIKKVIISSGVTSIGDFAFSMCDSLTSVTIPSSVTNIGIYAFFSCSSLTSVTIPNGVVYIGMAAFSKCKNLNSIIVESGNPNYSSIDGVLFNNKLTTIIAYPGGREGSYSIPKSVTYIGLYAFNGCSSLTSVIIPRCVTEIGSYAFSGCSSLTSVTIPSGVSYIWEHTFDGCSSLTSVTIPSSVTNIDSYAFSECSSLISVIVPGSVKSIGDYVFNGCSNLTSVTISDGVTSIGSYSFKKCSNLEGVTIPSSVTDIGSCALYECSSLTNVIIPNSITSIGNGTFCYCSSLTNVTIPSSVTDIENNAFFKCSSLTSVTIPSSVTNIGDYAFFSCSSLTSVTIPSSVMDIGSYAFYECSSLRTVYFDGNAPSIGQKVFLFVTATAYYPANDTTWTKDVKQNYGGKIKWVEKGVKL